MSNIVTGKLASAVWCPSPNFNERPCPSDISLIVVHNISLPPEEFGTGCIVDFFQNKLDVAQHAYFETIADLKVSSHLLIDRQGVITQFVNFEDRAWHAGVSCYQGREQCNDFSIGIELEGTDYTPFTDAQYQSLAQSCRALIQTYPALSIDTICGHSDIAPGRKTDPGPAFDWLRLTQDLA